MSTRYSNFGHQIEDLQEQIATLEQYVVEGQPLESPVALFQMLQTALEELHVADEELCQQHEELVVAYDRAEFEHIRYQELFNLAPDGYLVTDIMGVIREANATATALLSRSKSHLLGKPLAIFIAQDNRRLFYSALLQLRQRPCKTCLEITLQTPQAAPLIMEAAVAPVYDSTGMLVSLRWLLHDISARKQIEKALQEDRDSLERRVIERTSYLSQINEQLLTEIAERRHVERALRESEQRFRAVFDHAAVGIAVLDIDGTWRQANSSFCNMLEYTVEELYQQPWQQTTHPDDIAAEDEQLQRLTAHELSSYTREKRYISRQGKTLWGNVSVSVVRDAQGAPQYFIEVVEDITTRKVAEEQARQAEHALYASQERLRQLAAHIQELQEQERARIARELHDDLAQLLTGLRFDVSWFATQLENGPQAWGARVQAMQQQIEALHRAVHRIGTELRPTMLDDLGLFAAVEWHLQQTCHRTGLSYTLHLPDEEDLPLPAELATTLFRIFQEALTNIVRHAEASEVTVSIGVQSNILLLEVADNGKGMPPEHTMTRQTLGLLGMRERAALWNGQVHIAGVPGQGTTVRVAIAYPGNTGVSDDSHAGC